MAKIQNKMQKKHVNFQVVFLGFFFASSFYPHACVCTCRVRLYVFAHCVCVHCVFSLLVVLFVCMTVRALCELCIVHLCALSV